MVMRWVVGCLIALACAFWAVAIVASPASAQVSLSIYRSAIKEGISDSNKTYVTGLGRGVLWANVAAEDNGEVSLQKISAPTKKDSGGLSPSPES